MTVLPIPTAFWAETQAEAEALALAWAAAEPRIAEAHVTDAHRTLGTSRWTVTLEIVWTDEPQQAELGL